MTDEAATTDDRWIKAYDALQLAIARGEDPVAFKGAIAEYLRDGMLQARAKAVWTTSETNMLKAWRAQDTAEDVQLDVVVPVSYWRSDKRAAADRNRWQWPVNKFTYTVNVKPLKRRMIRGVELKLPDLERLRPTLFEPPKKSRGGRKHDVSARDAGWMEIVGISQDGLLNSDTYKTITSLKDEMKHRLQDADGDLRLGQKQIDEIAKQVVAVLKPRSVG